MRVLTDTIHTPQRKTKEKLRRPREYQLLAFEAAKQENTYVFLGTGLGKTLVAELLIQWHILKSSRSRSLACFVCML